MAIVIVAILILGLALIATENINKMNKAAVAMFMGIVCWLLYIGYGTSFVISEHQIDFLSYLSNNYVTQSSVREFIANHIFIKYSIAALEISIFLMSTITIVEVLNNNGCFDFIQESLRTINPKRFVWILAGITFILSANLDNVTTACMMLAIMHVMVADEKTRMMFGAVIILATNCGGAFTVIGDITSLTLWMNGLVSPTTYAQVLFLPCITALTIVLLLVSRKLPRRLHLVHTAPPYRGDDTILTRKQRFLLLLVGIGGLWSIPTLHRITLLPPFVGALCILALLWMFNELCNRSILHSDQMVRKRLPVALQYATFQNILYFIGLVMALGTVTETGYLEDLFQWLTTHLDGNIYWIGVVMGLLSAVLNNVTMLLGNISVFSQDIVQSHPELESIFTRDGVFWPLLSYTTAVGGSLLSIGSLAGYALMRMEDVTLRWYVRHFAGKVLAGWIAGLLVFYICIEYLI